MCVPTVHYFNVLDPTCGTAYDPCMHTLVDGSSEGDDFKKLLAVN